MAKKKAKKSGARRSAGKPRKASVMPASPKPVSTGKGPGPKQIGDALVRNFNRGKWSIDDKLWSPAIVSVEGLGFAFSGRKSVDAKNADWMSKHTIHGASAEGPFIGASGFAVKFRMDVEETATAKRFIMDEVGVYTVKNGKIVREEFMYGSMTPVTSTVPAAPPAVH